MLSILIFKKTIRNFYDKEFNFSIVQFKFWGEKRKEVCRKRHSYVINLGVHCAVHFLNTGGFFASSLIPLWGKNSLSFSDLQFNIIFVKHYML